MSLVLSHETALDIYRSSMMPSSNAKRVSIRALSAPTSRDATFFRMLPVQFASKNLHCVVPEPKDRREIGQGVCHVLGEDVEALFIRRIGADSLLSVVSPEVLFLQMAASLSLVELVKLGFELCGRYSLVANRSNLDAKEAKYLPRTEITDAAKLRAYVQGAERSRCVRKAREAVRYIVDGSASPRETELCMLLVMPRRLGGYGFDKPLISHSFKGLSQGDLLVHPPEKGCSLLWSKAHTVVEYLASAKAKEKKAEFDADASRKTKSPFGFNVVSVTDWHIKEAVYLDKVAKAVALGHGRSFRNDMHYDFLARQSDLRKQVLGRE